MWVCVCVCVLCARACVCAHVRMHVCFMRVYICVFNNVSTFLLNRLDFGLIEETLISLRLSLYSAFCG